MERHTVQFNVGMRDNPVSPREIKGLLSVAIMDNNEDPIRSKFVQGVWEGVPEQTLFVEFSKSGGLTPLDLERIGRVALLCNQDCIAVRWREDELTWAELVYRDDWEGIKIDFDSRFFLTPESNKTW